MLLATQAEPCPADLQLMMVTDMIATGDFDYVDPSERRK